MAVVIEHVPEERRFLERRGADAVVSALKGAGIRMALGLPGGTIGPVYDALIDVPEIQLVSTRHEAAAVFAAAGWSRMTGRPAVVLATSGPGALNLMNALASAHADRCPLLLLVGEVPTQRQGKGALQDGTAHGLDLVGAARPWCTWARSVATASALVPMVNEAVARAAHGPVMLTLPVDLLSQLAPDVAFVGDAVSPPILPDLSGVVSTLLQSRRPHLLIGRSARGQSHSILRLAERLDAPVATTPHGRGLFPDSHPLALGVFGVGGHPSAARALTQTADSILALGTDLGELASSGFDPRLSKNGPLIQVHPDAEMLARAYAVEWAVRAPVGMCVRSLLQQVHQRRSSGEQSRLKRHPFPASGAAGIHSGKAVQMIQELLPIDTVFAVDSGEHTFFAMQYLHLDLPDSWYALLGLGSMGAGVCGALGLALAAPERPIACLCGDGGLLMHLGELSTAAQLDLPIRWFVFNDGRLGMVVHGQTRMFGRSHSFEHGPIDLTATAAALGVAAIHVSTLDELSEHADLIANPGGPLVVVLDVDPTLSMPKGGRLASLGEALSEVPS